MKIPNRFDQSRHDRNVDLILGNVTPNLIDPTSTRSIGMTTSLKLLMIKHTFEHASTEENEVVLVGQFDNSTPYELAELALAVAARNGLKISISLINNNTLTLNQTTIRVMKPSLSSDSYRGKSVQAAFIDNCNENTDDIAKAVSHMTRSLVYYSATRPIKDRILKIQYDTFMRFATTPSRELYYMLRNQVEELSTAELMSQFKKLEATVQIESTQASTPKEWANEVVSCFNRAPKKHNSGMIVSTNLNLTTVDIAHAFHSASKHPFTYTIQLLSPTVMLVDGIYIRITQTSDLLDVSNSDGLYYKEYHQPSALFVYDDTPNADSVEFLFANRYGVSNITRYN